jgi:hypothetical protein
LGSFLGFLSHWLVCQCSMVFSRIFRYKMGWKKIFRSKKFNYDFLATIIVEIQTKSDDVLSAFIFSSSRAYLCKPTHKPLLNGSLLWGPTIPCLFLLFFSFLFFILKKNLYLLDFEYALTRSKSWYLISSAGMSK